MSYITKLKNLTKQLFPKGRAFLIPKDTYLEQLYDGIIASENDLYSDILSTLYVILPDNDNFTEEDATRWEERLGLITNSSVSLADRKLAIIRKINHPGTIPARQSWDYLQDQLQAAGFDVYVHENIFSDGMGGFETRSPADLWGTSVTGIAVHSTLTEHGVGVHGGANSGVVHENTVANYIDEDLDQFFDVGDNLRNTFYITSEYVEFPADVELIRKNEFRQLILRLKPVQTIAFLYINYV